MKLLTWRHSKTKAEVRDAMKLELQRLGYDKNVAWIEYKFTSSLPFGMLTVAGEISEQTIILDKCSGVMGGKVMAEFRSMLEHMFPGGEVRSGSDNQIK